MDYYPKPLDSLLSNRRNVSFTPKTQVDEVKRLKYSRKRVYTFSRTVHLNNMDYCVTLFPCDFIKQISDVFSPLYIDVTFFSSIILIGKHLQCNSVELFPQYFHLSTEYKTPMIYDIKTYFEIFLEGKAGRVTDIYVANTTLKVPNYEKYKKKVYKKLFETETFLVIFNQPDVSELGNIANDLSEFRKNFQNQHRILYIHIADPFIFPNIPKINLKIYKIGN